MTPESGTSDCTLKMNFSQNRAKARVTSAKPTWSRRVPIRPMTMPQTIAAATPTRTASTSGTLASVARRPATNAPAAAKPAWPRQRIPPSPVDTVKPRKITANDMPAANTPVQ